MLKNYQAIIWPWNGCKSVIIAAGMMNETTRIRFSIVSSSSAIVSGTCLWRPTQAQIENAEVTKFASFVQAKTQFDWGQDFQALWQWSVDHMPEFWDLLWDWHGIIAIKAAEFLPTRTKCLAQNSFQMPR